MGQRRSDTERLRKELEDYYGTAMFNGNPMAMIELEDALKANDDELRRLSPSHLAPRADSQPECTPSGRWGDGYSGSGSGSSAGSGLGDSRGIGISVSSHTQTIGPAATRFFEPISNDDTGFDIGSDTGFFAAYGRKLGDAAREGAQRDVRKSAQRDARGDDAASRGSDGDEAQRP